MYGRAAAVCPTVVVSRRGEQCVCMCVCVVSERRGADCTVRPGSGLRQGLHWATRPRGWLALLACLFLSMICLRSLTGAAALPAVQC